MAAAAEGVEDSVVGEEGVAGENAPAAILPVAGMYSQDEKGLENNIVLHGVW